MRHSLFTASVHTVRQTVDDVSKMEDVAKADVKLLGELHSRCADDAQYVTPRLSANTAFGVRHYAAEV